MRTAFRTDLIAMADAWTAEADKAVPAGLALDGAALRLWTLATGRWIDNGYLLGLDPRAPQTHEPLVKALALIGLPAGLLDARAGGPGVRLTGRRRLGRLVELVGRAPTPAAEECWPV